MNVKDLEIKGVAHNNPVSGDKLERVFVPTQYPIEDCFGKCVSHTRITTYGRECQLLIGVDQEHGFTLAGRLSVYVGSPHIYVYLDYASILDADLIGESYEITGKFLSRSCTSLELQAGWAKLGDYFERHPSVSFNQLADAVLRMYTAIAAIDQHDRADGWMELDYNPSYTGRLGKRK